jgi:hypothetical protein
LEFLSLPFLQLFLDPCCAPDIQLPSFHYKKYTMKFKA